MESQSTSWNRTGRIEQREKITSIVKLTRLYPTWKNFKNTLVSRINLKTKKEERFLKNSEFPDGEWVSKDTYCNQKGIPTDEEKEIEEEEYESEEMYYKSIKRSQ